MRALFTILSFLIFTSCSSTKALRLEQIIGEYKLNDIQSMRSTINLESDQTFEFIWIQGFFGGTTRGTWESKRKKIILRSEDQLTQYKNDTFEIVKTERHDSDSLSIKVIYIDKENIPYASCVLKQDTTTLFVASTDFNGDTKLPRLDADSLIISMIGFKTIRHKHDNEISTYVFIMYADEAALSLSYRYFADEIWKYRNKRLYAPSIKKGKYSRWNYYEKIE